MGSSEQQAIVTVALMAAMADGRQDEREREAIRHGVAQLGLGDEVDADAILAGIAQGHVDLAGCAATLADPALLRTAYQLAAEVCAADGMNSPAEQAFLARLREAFALDEAQVQPHAEQVRTLASAIDAPSSDTADAAAIERMILDAAILNGALELLPETLATMAIVPLQMRLVYRIGKAHGHELDQGHVRDFLATAGVGLASQYLEQAGRKLFGGLLGAIGGGVIGGLGRQAVSSGMSFASTWAIGHVAERYYAGGRTFSTDMLRDSFQQMLAQAKDLQANYLPQMREQARSLNFATIMEKVRGG